RALQKLYPYLIFVRVQDTQFIGIPDSDLLDEAAKVGAILLTHDVNTMSGFAYARINSGKPMSGVLLVHEWMPIGDAIKVIATLIESANSAQDFMNEVMWI
ncbi:MAG: hypothetical protein MUE54_10845, partial [Anaerolineae bacterium]|nr:hypothetical protein [Anaerolineae bacterium]